MTTTKPDELPPAKVKQERDYQIRIQSRIEREVRRGVKSILVVSPTGSGKSFLGLSAAKFILESAVELFGCEPHEVGIGWVAMRRTLLIQANSENELLVQCPNVHTISMFDPNPAAHLSEYKVKVLVFDEAHHAAANTCVALYNEIDPAIVIGLSATPQRSDKMDLCFAVEIKDAGYHRLIQEGWLSKFDHFSIDGDWSPANVARTYLANPEGWGQSVVFFLTAADCYECERLIAAGGVACTVVTGQTDREQQIEDFENGDVQVLINMMVLTEGFDCPSMQTVFVRDSANKGPITQMAGRVLRLFNGITKQIVQSLDTKYPFLRVASAHRQHVEIEGEWRTIGISEQMERMGLVMRHRMTNNLATTHAPKYLEKFANGSIWKHDKLIAKGAKRGRPDVIDGAAADGSAADE